jgi:hypothetical protein
VNRRTPHEFPRTGTLAPRDGFDNGVRLPRLQLLLRQVTALKGMGEEWLCGFFLSPA